jgi:hypothetical protein
MRKQPLQSILQRFFEITYYEKINNFTYSLGTINAFSQCFSSTSAANFDTIALPQNNIVWGWGSNGFL